MIEQVSNNRIGKRASSVEVVAPESGAVILSRAATDVSIGDVNVLIAIVLEIEGAADLERTRAEMADAHITRDATESYHSM